MQIFNKSVDLQELLSKWRLQKNKIVLVPTMGGLHAGHVSLINLAKKNNNKIVVSIFINPTQFSADEDFNEYPRTLKKDNDLLAQQKVDVIFSPSVSQIYPNGLSSGYDVGTIGRILCGKTRPHFFNGIAQVMRQLFIVVKPDIAIFGEKDYQQLLVIKQMVASMTPNIRILSSPIIRDGNGLALSTRNQYLTKSQTTVAANIYKVLVKFKQNYLQGQIISNIKKHAIVQLNKFCKLDYIKILDASNLQKITSNTQQIIVLLAVYLDSVRLIDNIKFER